MIENIELAHEMALAEDPYREVEIFARNKLRSAVLSSVILKFANRETTHIYRQWRERERAEDLDRQQAERNAIIDAMPVEQKRTHVSKGDFVESLTSIGHSKNIASRTWNTMYTNDYIAHRAVFARSSYPITFMEVPLPDYSRHTKRIDVLDIAMLGDALSNNRETMLNGAVEHLGLTDDALTVLDELVRLHQQPDPQI